MSWAEIAALFGVWIGLWVLFSQLERAVRAARLRLAWRHRARARSAGRRRQSSHVRTVQRPHSDTPTAGPYDWAKDGEDIHSLVGHAIAVDFRCWQHTPDGPKESA